MTVIDLLKHKLETYVLYLCRGNTESWAFLWPRACGAFHVVSLVFCWGIWRNFSFTQRQRSTSNWKGPASKFCTRHPKAIWTKRISVFHPDLRKTRRSLPGLRSQIIRRGRATQLSVDSTYNIASGEEPLLLQRKGNGKRDHNRSCSHTAANLHLFRRGCEGHRGESRPRCKVGIVATQHVNNNAFICSPSSRNDRFWKGNAGSNGHSVSVMLPVWVSFRRAACRQCFAKTCWLGVSSETRSRESRRMFGSPNL